MTSNPRYWPSKVRGYSPRGEQLLNYPFYV
jgi:hypothetical protein